MIKECVLASASPRRAELLKQIGVEFTIQVSNVDETIDEKVLPEVMVGELAYRKAYDVAKKCKNKLVIGADTIVVCDDIILGKPRDEQHAEEILTLLSDRCHKVMTGIAIVDSDTNEVWQWVETTLVYFRALSKEDIRGYLNRKEYIDKAGGYGIQGYGALLVEKIEGCYFNVVGLPLSALAIGLKEMGVNVYGNEKQF